MLYDSLFNDYKSEVLHLRKVFRGSTRQDPPSFTPCWSIYAYVTVGIYRPHFIIVGNLPTILKCGTQISMIAHHY